MNDVHIRDLEKVMNQPERFAIVDIRTEAEYASGHIPGSHNIPAEKFDSELKKFKDHEKIYIHCRSGNRVKLARNRILKHVSKEQIELLTTTGFLHWEAEGKPVNRLNQSRRNWAPLNMGPLDRTLRFILGGLAIGSVFYLTGPYRFLGLVGVIPLGTAIFKTCPLYTVFGISTCKIKQGNE